MTEIDIISRCLLDRYQKTVPISVTIELIGVWTMGNQVE